LGAMLFHHTGAAPLQQLLQRSRALGHKLHDT
jgi:hypothetical protein